MDPFARLPDDVLIAVLSRVGNSARDVTRAAMACRRWNEVTRNAPALSLGSSSGGAAANQATYLTFEVSVGPQPDCAMADLEFCVCVESPSFWLLFSFLSFSSGAHFPPSIPPPPHSHAAPGLANDPPHLSLRGEYFLSSATHFSAHYSHLPPLPHQRQASRMILRTRALRHLTVISPPAPPANVGGPCCPRGSQTPSSGCHKNSSEHPSPTGSARPSTDCAAGASALPRHPREFIFKAWMRHAGPSLHSLTLSRAVPDVTSLKRPRGGCASGTSGGNGGGSDGDGSVVVNLWEEEDASLHLAHISRHCTNLRSLSLGHVSLSAPTLLAALQPMPALQHLSLSWLHASPAALHAVLEATPNLHQLTIFMASGFPHLELRLSPSLQHLSLSYIRADSVTILSACSLQSLSHRDMFLGALSIRGAPNLRQLVVACANSLLVSANHSSQLESIDLRAGSLNWAATETLISANSAALESLSLDFFATISSGLPSVSSLPWLARNCPGLRSLRLGALAWQSMVDSAVVSGLLQSPGKSGASGTLNDGCLWPRLEVLTVRIAEKTPEGLLLLHSILCNIPTLKALHVTVEGEDVEDVEEEEEVDVDEEYGDCDATGINEYEEEEEEGYHIDRETKYFSHSPARLSVARAFSDQTEPDTGLARFTQPVGYGFALTAAERQHQLFLKGLDCLQRRFGCFHLASPCLHRRTTY
ncbi:unnamed protein product [Closterium sp. NIES-53]